MSIDVVVGDSAVHSAAHQVGHSANPVNVPGGVQQLAIGERKSLAFKDLRQDRLELRITEAGSGGGVEGGFAGVRHVFMVRISSPVLPEGQILFLSPGEGRSPGDWSRGRAKFAGPVAASPDNRASWTARSEQGSGNAPFSEVRAKFPS